MQPHPPPPPQVVASCGTTDLLEDGAHLRFVERGGGGLSVAIFVFGLIGALTGINAVFLGLQGYPVPTVLALGTVALLCLAGCALTLRAHRARAARPVHTLPVVLVLDRARGVACEADGRPLASLHDVVFRPQMQLASSSSALAASWPGGVRVVARGSPFTGSVDPMRDALQARGFRVG